jgi:hypothetical protein
MRAVSKTGATMNKGGISPAQTAIQIAFGFINARALYVAAKLDVADHLKDGPKTAIELAAALSVKADALYRIMRVLAASGVFMLDQDDRFSLNEIGDTLRGASAQSVRDYVIMYHECVYPSFAHVVSTVRTGESGQIKAFGKRAFEMVKTDPAFAAIVYAGLASRAKLDIATLMAAYDFSDAEIVADIGGGNGGLLSAILGRYPNVSGLLFDLAPAIDAAKAGKGGSLPGCKFVVGNFFDAVPTGADVYILKLVLHDWNDSDVERILTCCRNAMRPTNRLLIIEGLVGPPDEMSLTTLVDITMLINVGGRERTQAEFEKLIDRSGLGLQKVFPTESALYILEATLA